MLNVKDVFEMEIKLMESISLGFFEHGTHEDMDLIIYEAYSSVQMLRKILDVREKELWEIAEALREDFKNQKGE